MIWPVIIGGLLVHSYLTVRVVIIGGLLVHSYLTVRVVRVPPPSSGMHGHTLFSLVGHLAHTIMRILATSVSRLSG